MRRISLLCLTLLSAPAFGGTVVSREVSDVSVTIYRDPNRREGEMQRDWPGGYALISETRTIVIPAGESTIRFEGVAEGLLPETAIITGLPKAVREKNRDARLISPSGLVDAYLKRSVHLRRTDMKTGKVREQDAVIQAGPNGGVVLKTSEGFEVLGCSGLPERMMYDRVPEDLSPRPTLSVIASSDHAVTATVQLTYMAQGFDWSANYVATVHGDTKATRLFAWLTVANGGVESFRNARLQVIAGQPNKERNAPRPARPQPELRLQCWPMDTTSTHPGWGLYYPPPPAPPMPAMAMDSDAYQEIVVTGAKRGERAMMVMAPVAMKAEQEDLGDLKLYRVPERVTVAAQGQKQVAMIDQPEARFSRIYRVTVGTEELQPASMAYLLRARNEKSSGLGLPLPAGRAAVFETLGDNDLLVGETDLRDLAIAEDVELELGRSPDVTWKLTKTSESRHRQSWSVEIANARAVDIEAEVIVPFELANKPAGLQRGKGGWKMPLHIRANDTATVRYTIKLD